MSVVVDRPVHDYASDTSSSTLTVPDRTLLQRMQALEHANAVRSRRAQLKRDIKAGKVLFVDMLREPPGYLETAKIIDIFLAVPKWGRVKVNKALSTCRISPSKTLGGLSERQRLELVDVILRHR